MPQSGGRSKPGQRDVERAALRARHRDPGGAVVRLLTSSANRRSACRQSIVAPTCAMQHCDEVEPETL